MAVSKSKKFLVLGIVIYIIVGFVVQIMSYYRYQQLFRELGTIATTSPTKGIFGNTIAFMQVLFWPVYLLAESK